MKLSNSTIDRRNFLKQSAPLAGLFMLPGWLAGLNSCNNSVNNVSGALATRGLILDIVDLGTLDWPALAHEAGLTTIGTHVFPAQVAAFIQTDKGQQFLNDCKKYGVEVEHELHSMKDLLPRELFEKNPEMFRMNEEGVRVSDFNCCPNSKEALGIIAENAVKYGKILTPTTLRFFYWIDDAVPMCHCHQCKDLSDSDQSLIIENAMLKALKKEFPGATLAHLAYVNTITPPTVIKPEEGIFLEFAPIYRRWDTSLSNKTAGADAPKQGDGGFFTHEQTMQMLYENLKVFPKDTAQVLEYWLDVSLQSGWKKPAKKIAWYPEVCKADVEIYKKAGINHITSFGVYIDGAYQEAYGKPDFVKEYADILKGV